MHHQSAALRALCDGAGKRKLCEGRTVQKCVKSRKSTYSHDVTKVYFLKIKPTFDDLFERHKATAHPFTDGSVTLQVFSSLNRIARDEELERVIRQLAEHRVKDFLCLIDCHHKGIRAGCKSASANVSD